MLLNNESKFGLLLFKIIAAGAVVFLMLMPFLFELPKAPIKQEKPPVVVDTKPKVKPRYVESYIPKHNVKLPDFAAIRDVKEKKRQFFNYMMPYVERENERLLNLRIWLLEVRNKFKEQGVIEKKDNQRLIELAKTYRVKHQSLSTIQTVSALLKRVDGLPKELVLMQAANESAWGSSRFARLGLNFFGQWCYSKHCGIVPRGRPEGKKYEVKAFMSVQGSVKGYFKNINTNPAYQLLRDIRAQLRANHLPLDPHVLATGLLPYSERGDHYVQEISKMIEHNQQYMGD